MTFQSFHGYDAPHRDFSRYESLSALWEQIIQMYKYLVASVAVR